MTTHLNIWAYGADLVRVSNAARKYHDQCVSWRENGIFGSYFHIIVQRKSKQELKQGSNLETDTNAEAMEECYSKRIQPGFLKNTEPLDQG